MRLATIKLNGKEIAGIVTESGILPIAALNAAKGTAWREEMYELICAQQVPGLTKWYNEGGKDELETIPGRCAPGPGGVRPPVPESPADLRHRPELRRARGGHRQRPSPGLPGQLL